MNLPAILAAHAAWVARGRTGEGRAVLRGAVLRGAVLTRAVLTRAVLTYADLRGTDFTGADLTGADLTGADLTGAVLRGAVLRGADLTRADLTDATLGGVLRGVLTDADFTAAILTGVRGLPDLATPGLAARVVAQIDAYPETHVQVYWHSICGTFHCAAGWACVLAAVPGEVEERLGTAHAARLALGLPLSAEAPFGGDDDPLPWLSELAAREVAS